MQQQLSTASLVKPQLCLVSAHRAAAGHAYAAVISACAAGGQWQKAVTLFDEMLAWGVRPDVVSCTALITGERWGQGWGRFG